MERYTSGNKETGKLLVLKNAVECINNEHPVWTVSRKENGTNTITGEAVNRFFDYEELGLEPAQLKEIDNLYSEKCKEMVELKGDISQLNNDCAGLSQENELFKAENEQLKEELKRSIKLPCKVGDTVYQLKGRFIKKEKILGNVFITDLFSFNHNDFGKTVFFTRKEALAKRKNNVK